MREKIKQISALGWVGIILVGVSLSILIPTGMQSFFDIGLVNPWKIGNTVATKLAIDIFSEGVPGDVVFTKERISALLSILFFLILGPGLMILFGLKPGPKTDSEKGMLTGTMVGFLAGMVITLAALVTFTMESVMMSYVHENSRASASKSAVTDDIRQNLATLAWQSYEYWVLPEEHGGGGGSFEGLAIEDLENYEELSSGNYRFTETSSDTLLRIVGSAKPDYPADDPNREEVEVAVFVQPSDIMRWDRSE